MAGSLVWLRSFILLWISISTSTSTGLSVDGCGLWYSLELYTSFAIPTNHTFHFTEVKALKSLVRNVIAPERDLGHTDRALKAQQSEQKEKTETKEESKDAKACEDCQ